MRVVNTYGHFHVINQRESVLPRKARVARSWRLADLVLFAQIINGRCKQLDSVVDQCGLHLCVCVCVWVMHASVSIVEQTHVFQYIIIATENFTKRSRDQTWMSSGITILSSGSNGLKFVVHCETVFLNSLSNGLTNRMPVIFVPLYLNGSKFKVCISLKKKSLTSNFIRSVLYSKIRSTYQRCNNKVVFGSHKTNLLCLE